MRQWLKYQWPKYIYAYMARMSVNDKCPCRKFCDSSQLNNWILDSWETCHLTPEVLGFVSGLLEDKDKHIKVSNGHHVMAKHKGEVQIKCVTITEILLSQRYTM